MPDYKFDKKFKIKEFIYCGGNSSVWITFCLDMGKYYPGLGRYAKSSNIDIHILAKKFKIDECVLSEIHSLDYNDWVDYDDILYPYCKVVVALDANGKIVLESEASLDKYFHRDRAYRECINRVAQTYGFSAANLVEIPEYTNLKDVA